MSPTAESTHKIGELAETSGVTVRTLHYYEEIGLLMPMDRTDAGHRFYGPSEVARLARLVGTVSAGSEPTMEILDVLEDMSMLETTVNRPIASLVYVDLEAAFTFLTDVFGLGPGELTKDPDGNVVHGEVEAGTGTIWLHPESAEFRLGSPQNTGVSTGTMVIIVDDVDAHHRHAADRGAEIRYAPVDQPYGYREYGAHDSEGHLWSFMKPLGS